MNCLDSIFLTELVNVTLGYKFCILTNFHRIISRDARVVNGLDLNHTDQSSNGFGLARSNRVGVVTTLYFCDRYVYAVSRTHFLPTSSCRPCACNVVAEFGIFMHFK